MAIVDGCNPFLVKDRWFESSLAQYFIYVNVAELVYAVVLGAMSFGLLVRVQSLIAVLGT